MARRSLSLLCLTAWFAGSMVAAAQPPGTPKGQAVPPGSADRVAHIMLGQADVPLYGPWKFAVGDSPLDPNTGKPLWAESDFDDSRWDNVDLAPKVGAIDPTAGIPG